MIPRRPSGPPQIPDHRTALRRRRLLLWSALPVLLVLGIAGKLLSLSLLTGQASSAFDAGDAGAVHWAAEGLGLANVVERHKAPFAAGDAKALSGDYPAARLLFEEALAAVPAGSRDECVIRINLGLAIETLGDGKLEADDPASAALLYAEALDIVEGAPAGCFAGDLAAESGRQLTDAKGRLNDKIAAASGPADPGEQVPRNDAAEGRESARQSQLEQLEEDARQAQRERNAGRERAKYLDSDSGAGVDRPW